MARGADAAAGAADSGAGQGGRGQRVEGAVLGHARVAGGEAGSCVGCTDEGGGGGAECG